MTQSSVIRWLCYLLARSHAYVVGSKSFRPDQLFKVTEIKKNFAIFQHNNNKSRHSNTEHRASTRILHLTLFLASTLISAQVLLIPLASSSTVLRHVFFGLPLPRLPCGFHSRACLAMSLDGFRSAWPSHPHLHFLIC